MKITAIRTACLEKPLDGAFRNPRARWTVKRSLLVFVETDGARPRPFRATRPAFPLSARDRSGRFGRRSVTVDRNGS